MLFKNKIGGEKLFSLWWLFVIVIVAGGIVWGVSVFYSAEVDVNKIEAEILINKISDCFFEQGLLIDGLLKEDFDIFYECKLNKKIIDNEFYFEIFIFDEIGGVIKKFSEGAHENACVLEGKKSKDCVKKTRGILYKQDNKIKKGGLEISTASNQKGISLTK